MIYSMLDSNNNSAIMINRILTLSKDAKLISKEDSFFQESLNKMLKNENVYKLNKISLFLVSLAKHINQGEEK